MRTPSKQNLDAHERLRAELHIRGTSLARIARELGVSDAALTLVGKGGNLSRRIEKALARAVGITPEALFPDRYQGGEPWPRKGKGQEGGNPQGLFRCIKIGPDTPLS